MTRGGSIRKGNNMKNLIKALSLLLALTMFTAILAACGGVEDPVTENTVTEPESLETSVIDHIPVKDFSSGGKPKDITVLVRDGQTYTQEIWVEKATSDPVDFAGAHHGLGVRVDVIDQLIFDGRTAYV